MNHTTDIESASQDQATILGSTADRKELVFRARGVTKVYDMGEVQVHALRGVDLDLFESEFTVLLGPSGSGKSTLLNILGGLDTPSGGEVHYRGGELTAADEKELTRTAGTTWASSSSSTT